MLARDTSVEAILSLSDYLRDELTGLARRPTVADVLARVASRQGGATSADIVRAVREQRDGSSPS